MEAARGQHPGAGEVMPGKDGLRPDEPVLDVFRLPTRHGHSLEEAARGAAAAVLVSLRRTGLAVFRAVLYSMLPTLDASPC